MSSAVTEHYALSVDKLGSAKRERTGMQAGIRRSRIERDDVSRGLLPIHVLRREERGCKI